MAYLLTMSYVFYNPLEQRITRYGVTQDMMPPDGEVLVPFEPDAMPTCGQYEKIIEDQFLNEENTLRRTWEVVAQTPEEYAQTVKMEQERATQGLPPIATMSVLRRTKSV